VDDPISYGLGGLIEVTIAMFMRLGAVIVFTPVFVVPGAVVAILGYWSGQIYMKAQLSVKREMSNAKSPVLSHFGAAIAGLSKSISGNLGLTLMSYRQTSFYSCLRRTACLQKGINDSH
jgi:hypothetical protein